MSRNKRKGSGAAAGNSYTDPDEPIDEAARREMEAIFAGARPPVDPEKGSMVKGRVVQIGKEDVFVEIGAKSEAAISREELLDEQGEFSVKVGDSIEAAVMSVEDGIRLSRRLRRGAVSMEGLRDAYQSGLPVEGKVEAVRKGGYEVALAGGVRAFCPLSQMDDARIEDQAAWVGRTLTFLIMELDDRGRNVVVSRRRVLARESAKKAEEAKTRVIEGAVLPGRVVSLQAYGAFVDLGGMQGLLHVSEISHRRVGHPSEVLKVGEQLTVKVLKVDSAAGKVSLGLKQLAEDPWSRAAEKVHSGDRREGRVVRVAEFGAFVELEPGLDGLVHVSELAAGKKGADARKLIQAGETILVKVLEVDAEARRISLGRIDPDAPEQEVELHTGSLVSGKVDRVEPFGVFVRLGPGMTGLIRNEEMGTPLGTDHRRDFAPGTAIEAEVVAVEDGGRRISLSRARAQSRSERQEIERFRTQPGGGLSAGFSTLADAFKKSFNEKEED